MRARDQHVLAVGRRDGRQNLEHPERVAGLHFFNPVAVLPLVEIIRTPETDDTTLATVWDVATKLQRLVLVKDAPAFVVNRVLTRMTVVLMDALEQGNTVEETDEAILTGACRWRRPSCCRWSARGREPRAPDAERRVP